ncbi:MAG: hypothetical protein AMK75_04750 [Planctomycetes bacterium SM23_65]|nr:MAG: hypothetical protein AMK75_04750 [Planctomycetes bacterium SM23_65]
MKAALTGATGFIGRYIAREFMTPEDTLRAMVRPTSNSQFLKERGAELVVGDFGDDDSLRKLVDGMDVVIHNGYWHDRNELQEPMKWFELNVLGSLKLLEYSRRAGLKRFLFISSGAVYGRVRNPEEPRDELTGCFPRGGYAAYNRAVEVYVPAYRSEFDMTGSASVRLCGRNVGVHRKIEASAYIDIVKAALAGEDIHVAGNDQPDCCVDIARNLRVLAELPLERVEEVYCFCGDVFSTREIAEAIVRGTGSKSKVIEDAEAREFTSSSNERIKRAGGTFSGLTGIEAYARELVEALAKN